MILYEYPLHERIRTWLRLEDLFEKVRFFIEAEDARSHHAALLAIFELVEMTSRSEMKNELIQEAERQKTSLEALRTNPAVDAERLDQVLSRASSVLSDLYAMSGKIGQHVRDNEWLMTIKGRTGIPGGVCGFDLPSYHYWLHAPDSSCASDLRDWLAPFMPLQAAVEMILNLLRESGNGIQHVANQGLFQLMLGGRTAHLVRIKLADDISCAPEVSANKYALNVRFITLDINQKPRTCGQDIPFELTFCNL